MIVNYKNQATGHRMNNGWNLFYASNLTMWRKDEKYLLLDENQDVVMIFGFKKDEIILDKLQTWGYTFGVHPEKNKFPACSVKKKLVNKKRAEFLQPSFLLTGLLKHSAQLLFSDGLTT